MLHKILFLALATMLVAVATPSKARAWGCYHASYHYGGYSSGYHASYTHYGPETGFQHGSIGGGSSAYGGYHYGTAYHYGGSSGYSAYGGYHYGGYGGYSAGYARRW